MNPDDPAIKLLDDLARVPREAGPVSLEADYMRAIEHIESLPQNQSGADKKIACFSPRTPTP